MSDRAPSPDPFELVASFVTEAGKLERRDAEIYALGLRKVVVTTGEVTKEFQGMHQNTAGDRLNHLTRLGFFEETPSDRKKGVEKRYRAIPPWLSMKGLFAKFSEVSKANALLVEHFEQHVQTPVEEDDLWLTQSQASSASRGAALIAGATKSVKISSNDCSWIHEREIRDAVVQVSRRIPVTVVANPPPREERELRKMRVKLVKVNGTGIPFCIIDDRILIQIGQTGTARKQYNMETTSQEYRVKKQIELFERLLGKPRSGGT